MKRVIMFTGQIRDPDRFSLMLRTIDKYRGSHDPVVLLSTWPNEVARYPDLRPVLAAAKVHIVAQEEPGVRSGGHLLHQLFAIDAGLALCDRDDYVLKTRGDLGFAGDIDAFFASDRPAPVAPGSASPFAARVATRGFFAAQPFYINDITFAGRAGDLRKLSAMPAVASATYSRRNSTEQMIWGPSFAALRPEIETYFRLNPGLVFNDPDLQGRTRARLTGSMLYHRALALFFIAVSDSLGWLLPEHDAAAVAEACAQRTLEDLLWSKEPMVGLLPHPGCATNFLTRHAAAQAIAGGHYANSAFGEAIADRVRRYRADPAIPAAAMLQAEADALFNASVGEPGMGGMMRHFVRHPDSTRLSGALPDWLAERAAADSVQELESELAALRRANDRLIAQLRTLGA